MKISSTLVALTTFLCISQVHAQMKIVIMGSSTAYGIGASSYSNSWAGKIESDRNQNPLDGRDTVFYNIAFPGYDTYQEMPSDYIPPAGRPLPDDDHNVTKALSYNPDVVIINLPSNDISYGYSKLEMISNLRYMSSAIFASGKKCFITTPQPRNDFDGGYRDSLVAMVDSINRSFGLYAINFWDRLVTTDGLNMLREEFCAAPSPLHLNNAGHNLLFETIRDSYIFHPFGIVSLQLTNFEARPVNNSVSLKWHIEQQAPNTHFEIQRSSDGIHFETIIIRHITEARSAFNYYETDNTPLQGRSFYRLKITSAAEQLYSRTISITTALHAFRISGLESNNTNLTLHIDSPESNFVFIEILNTSGATLMKQKAWVNAPGNTVILPVTLLSAGQYFVRVVSSLGKYDVRAFIKIY